MTDYLYHHGIKGMRWGVRRFQNKDGSYTAAGKKRYGDRGSEDGKANSDGPKGQSDRRRVARNVAIGVAAVAAVGTVGYVAVKNSNWYKERQIVNDIMRKQAEHQREDDALLKTLNEMMYRDTHEWTPMPGETPEMTKRILDTRESAARADELMTKMQIDYASRRRH